MTKALRWVQTTTDIGMEFKVETSAKERDQKILDFNTIDIIKLEYQQTSSQDIMNLPMNPKINIFLNKQPMSRYLINPRLLHPYENVMKAICCHQNLYGLPKHCSRKIHKAPCTIFYTEKMTTINKGPIATPVTFNQENFFIWSLHVPSDHSFTSVLTVVCAKNRML